MSRNWESWLRGETREPQEAGNLPAEKTGEDVAALLGLPVAVSRAKETEEEGPSGGTRAGENESLPPVSSGFPSAGKEAYEFQPVKEPVGAQFQTVPAGPGFPGTDAEEDFEHPGRNGDEWGLQEEKSVSSPFGVRGSGEKTGIPPRSKRMAAAGIAAAVAVGAYFLFGRESTGELILKGREHSRGGDYAQALVYFHRAAEKDPFVLEALLGIADALERLGRKGEALDAYYRCLQAAPGNPQIHARLGFLFFSMSSFDKAIRSFQESLNFDPSSGEVFAGMGRAYEAKGDYVQAVSAYKKALELEPLSEEFRKNYEEAEKTLSRKNEEAERLERDILAKEQVLLGRAALGLGDQEESSSSFLRALDHVPDDHDALMGMGDVKKASGDLEGAAGYYKTVLGFYPDSGLASSALAETEKALALRRAEEELKTEEKKDGAADAPQGASELRKTEKDSPGKQKEQKEMNNMAKPRKPSAAAPSPPQKAPPAARPTRKEKFQAGKTGAEPRLSAPVPEVRNTKFGKEGLQPAGSSFGTGEKRMTGIPAPEESPEALSAKGAAQLARGNYSSAFGFFWKGMLLPPSRVSGEQAAFTGKIPFSGRRWRDIAPVENGPLGRSIPLSIALPDRGNSIPDWAQGKASLIEALSLNPKEGGVYLNLAMSYILLRKERGAEFTPGMRDEEEQAVYYSLLAHAWLRNGERDKAALFLKAAKKRARGEIRSHVLSLERFFLGREKRGT